MLLAVGKAGLFSKRWQKLRGEVDIQGLGRGGVFPRVECDRMASRPFPSARLQAHAAMQHYGVNGYSLHAMNSLSAMYNLHQQAAQQAQHAPDYRPSVHALTLAERLAGKGRCGDGGCRVEERSGGQGSVWKVKAEGSTGNEAQEDPGHSWYREMSCKICVRIQTTRVSRGPGPRSCPVPYFTFP